MALMYWLDLAGTMVFAISGSLSARQKKLDVFAAGIIAFITALGGGTIRDVLIGASPVGWMHDVLYLWAILLGLVLARLFGRYFISMKRTLALFDTIGIGLFTIIGLEKTLALGLHPGVALVMGVVSAVFGGVLRDTLCNDIPFVFGKEIYATACLAGGVSYLILNQFWPGSFFVTLLAVSIIIATRLLTKIFQVSLPRI